MAWTQEQLRNAGIIYNVGVSMGMSTRDIQIGLITAMVESNLINVNYGDRDSLGLFQQRPSQGWGTPEQVTNPQYAAAKFYSALKGLGDKRYQMGMGEAAQAVQRSAFPERYAERIGAMRELWPSIQKAGGGSPKALDGTDYPTSGASASASAASAAPSLMPDLSDIEVTPPPTASEIWTEAYGTDTELVGTPDASMMLGAWGMGTNSLGLMPDPEPLELPGAGFSLPAPGSVEFDAFPIANQSTNTEIIKPMAETATGGFEKGTDAWRKAVVQAAKIALGKPYVWGGNSLQSGVDCSGLIQQAYAQVGLSMPRVSYQQANAGKRVALSALEPGDLVAWDNSSRNNGADHIAMYIGNGQIIEAARTGIPVRIRNLGSDEGAWGVKISR